MSTVTVSDEMLEAIADAGSREHVLRHIHARYTMGEMDAVDVAHEEDIDVSTADVETVAEAFVAAWDAWVADVTTDEQHTEYIEYLEQEYGTTADRVTDQ